MDFESKWALVRCGVEAFAAKFGHRNTFIKTNGKEFIRRKSIRPDIPVWWAYVQHGMGLSGLCVPALYHDGATEIMISSSQWQGYDYPWGSLPEIDNEVRCAGIAPSHQGFDLTRQDKLKYIVAKSEKDELPFPDLRVCARPYAVEFNCERCEKCLRTMAGVVVAGGDPRHFGFSMTVRELHNELRESYERSHLTMLESELYLWQDIRKHAQAALSNRNGDKVSHDAETFLRWITGLGFEDYSRTYAHRHRWELRAKRWLSRYPALFEVTRNAIERRRWFGY